MTSSPGPRPSAPTFAISSSKVYSSEWNSLVRLKSVVPSRSPGVAIAMVGLRVPSACAQSSIGTCNPAHAGNVGRIDVEGELDIDLLAGLHGRAADLERQWIEHEPGLTGSLGQLGVRDRLVVDPDPDAAQIDGLSVDAKLRRLDRRERQASIPRQPDGEIEARPGGRQRTFTKQSVLDRHAAYPLPPCSLSRLRS